MNAITPIFFVVVSVLRLATGPESPANVVGILHKRFETLSHVFDSCSIKGETRIVSAQGVIPILRYELDRHGTKERYRVIHFGPRFRTQALAEKHDENSSIVVSDGNSRVVYYDGVREAHIYPFAFGVRSELTLVGHAEQMFVRSSSLLRSLDDPLSIIGVDQLIYRFPWRELIFPDAFLQTGWSCDSTEHGILVLSRSLSVVASDRVYIDTNKNDRVLARELSFGRAMPAISFVYDDFREAEAETWIPFRRRSTRQGITYEDQLLEIDRNVPAESRFQITYPPGTRVIDEVSQSVSIRPGGEELLDEWVENQLHLFSPFKRNPWPRLRELIGLARFLSLVTVGVSLCAWMSGSPRGRRWLGCLSLPRAHRGRAGFTLVELLVVLAVIGILLALVLPAIQAARGAAMRAQCSNNLKQIALGIHQYHIVQGQLPIGRPLRRVRTDPATTGASPFVSILPYLDQSTLYHAFNSDVGPQSISNLTVELSRPSAFLCPADAETSNFAPGPPGLRRPAPDPSPHQSWPIALTGYGTMYGTVILDWEVYPDPSFDPNRQQNGSFNYQQHITWAEFTDGMAHTAILGERAVSFLNRDLVYPAYGHWTCTYDIATTLHATHPINSLLREDSRNRGRVEPRSTCVSSFHPNGTHVALGDGSVRFIRDTIDCWPIDPEAAAPVGAYMIDRGIGGLPKPGVWQALITRSGGEVISEY